MLESENPGFTSPIEGVEEALLQKMVEKGLTLSCAESCTGGGIARRIIGVAGSSQYFLGGVVSYANSAKRDLLGVKETTLDQFGAVSKETAREMAIGAKKALRSDVAVSVTGVAGPSGGTEEKPVGMVIAAIQMQDLEPYIWTMQHGGTREEIIEQTVEQVLQNLYQYLRENV